MAGPMMSAPVSAGQIAQQKLQDQGAQQLKQGGSKFDAAMTNKAQQAQATQQVAQTQSVQGAQSATAATNASKVSQAKMVDAANKADKAGINRKLEVRQASGSQGAKGGNQSGHATAPAGAAEAHGAGGSKSATGSMMKMVNDLERGQGVMDNLIQEGLSGKQFSSGELLALQAGMFKYTQELELTGKVVEKATSGLKDTLKTQV